MEVALLPSLGMLTLRPKFGSNTRSIVFAVMSSDAVLAALTGTAGVGRAGDLVAPEVVRVPSSVGALFPHGGPLAGSVLACEGPAAWSLAADVVAPSVAAGTWMLIIDVATTHACTVEPEALSEAGVPLERVVRITADAAGSVHVVDLVIAGLEGFGVVLLVDPGSLTGAAERRLRRRLVDRGAMVVVVRPHQLGRRVARGAAADAVMSTSIVGVDGIGEGWGRLTSRRVMVSASGRRLHGGRHVEISLPDESTAGVSAPDALP